ncbi:MAG: polyphenol oxidase family protein [Myxococcota bacterium]|nr:polyphenol oxidase family protein [Myxococcota bacterium]
MGQGEKPEVGTIVEQLVDTCPDIPKFELAEWWRDFGVVAGITGAGGGFDLGLWGNQPSGVAMNRWYRLMESFDPPFVGSVVSHQHHGNSIAYSGQFGGGLLVRYGYDGHITAESGILLTVVVADCVPVYLYETRTRAMALLHAGWRGTAAKILARGVEELNSRWQCRVEDIVMHCGVCICGDCYEVGPEVVEQLTGRAGDGPEKIDLRTILVNQALELGIERTTVSTGCTACDETGRFHSYRASGGSTGRMVAYLGMPPG